MCLNHVSVTSPITHTHNERPIGNGARQIPVLKVTCSNHCTVSSLAAGERARARTELLCNSRVRPRAGHFCSRPDLPRPRHRARAQRRPKWYRGGVRSFTLQPRGAMDSASGPLIWGLRFESRRGYDRWRPFDRLAQRQRVRIPVLKVTCSNHVSVRRLHRTHITSL